jgi:ribosomal protein L7Ae-like RNA K-turn-binding protein
VISGETRPFVVYGFESTHAALAAESLLKDMGVAVVPVPAPKSIGRLCGIALRVAPAESARAEELLSNAGMEPNARVEIEDV